MPTLAKNLSLTANNSIGDMIRDEILASSFANKFISYTINPQDHDGEVVLELSSALTAPEESEWESILAAHQGGTTVKKHHQEIFKLFSLENNISKGGSWIPTNAGMLDPEGLGTNIEQTAVHIIFQYTCFGSDAEVRLVQEVVSDNTTSNIIDVTVLANTAADAINDAWVTIEIEGSIGQLGFNGLCNYFIEARNNTSQNFKIRDAMCEFVTLS